MNSRMETFQRNKRFFRWTAMLATMLASALIVLEIAFPPDQSPYGSSSGADLTAFNLHDLQLLVLVSALVVSVASFAGIGLTTLLIWIARRKEQEEPRPSSLDRRRGRRKTEPSLTREPANARIAALRAVVSPVEEAPGTKA
jgi:hypothetical protein